MSFNQYDYLASLSDAERADFHAREAAAVKKIREDARLAREKQQAELAKQLDREKWGGVPPSMRGMMIGGSDLPPELRRMGVKNV